MVGVSMIVNARRMEGIQSSMISRHPLISRGSYHEVLLADPTVRGELLQHGNKVLDAAVPVAEQEDHHEQGEDAEEEPHHLQVGVGDLSGRRGS